MKTIDAIRVIFCFSSLLGIYLTMIQLIFFLFFFNLSFQGCFSRSIFRKSKEKRICFSSKIKRFAHSALLFLYENLKSNAIQWRVLRWKICEYISNETWIISTYSSTLDHNNSIQSWRYYDTVMSKPSITVGISSSSLLVKSIIGKFLEKKTWNSLRTTRYWVKSDSSSWYDQYGFNQVVGLMERSRQNETCRSDLL